MRKINYLFFSILAIIIANDYELSIVLFLQGFGVLTKSLLIFVRWFEIMTFNVMNRMVWFGFYVSFTFIFLSFWFFFSGLVLFLVFVSCVGSVILKFMELPRTNTMCLCSHCIFVGNIFVEYTSSGY